VACVTAGGLAMLACVLLSSGHAAGIVAPMMLYLCGVGLVMPQAMAGALTPFPGQAGTASSFAGLVQMLTGALAGVLVGRMLGTTAIPLPAVIAATGLGTLIVFRLSRRVRAIEAVAPGE
jgi:DHA1 family bicyclomycin/chloramphenicol resistance-like MFS transporter